jgi:hypothetical protein
MGWQLRGISLTQLYIRVAFARDDPSAASASEHKTFNYRRFEPSPMSIPPSYTDLSSGLASITAGSRGSWVTATQNSTCDTDIPEPPLRGDMDNLGALASFRGCLFCDDENTTVITGEQTPWVLLWHRQEKRWYRPHCREDQEQADEDFYGYVCSQHGNQETMGDIHNQLKLVPCFSFPSKKIPHFDIYFISRGGDNLDDEQTSVEMNTISAAEESSLQTTVDTESLDDSATGGPSAASDVKSGHGDDDPLAQLKSVHFETGPHDAFRCLLCDKAGPHRLMAANKTRFGGMTHYQLLPLYFNRETDEWQTAYMPTKGVHSPIKRNYVRCCGSSHRHQLTKLVDSIRSDQGNENFSTSLSHQTQRHLTLHLMSIRKMTAKAEEQLEKKGRMAS